MKKFLLNTIYFLWIVGGIAIVVYNVFFSENPNYQHVAKIVVVLLVCFVTAVSSIRKRSKEIRRTNEKTYKEFIQDAFSNNENAYNRLMKMLEYYNKDKLKKALNLSAKLLEDCTNSREYGVVYFFTGACFTEAGLHEEAIDAYREALDYDGKLALAWSNIGVEYMELGKSQEAEKALLSAVTYDSHLAIAYTNLSILYLRKGEPELSIDHALQAIKLDSNQTEAMSSAAMAYKMLGKERSAEKYSRMYIANGGSKRELQESMKELE